MSDDKHEFLITCYFADKQFNECFDNCIFRKNVLDIASVDIGTQHNNEYNAIPVLHIFVKS